VNMPARTTVISALSKRTDKGVGPLQVAQLLQMAGRAGRRGKDVQGSVVLMRSRYRTGDYSDTPRARGARAACAVRDSSVCCHARDTADLH
jgi:superfamily II RNA helicase